MLPLYALTLGLSALLMFWVQPLYARLALPLLGGAPAVWITAMLFFQAALLAGYLYAHLSVRWLGLKRQSLLHAAILLLAFVALPISLPEGWTPPPGAMPAGWQIGLMAVGVGLPFFALSATAPLLQRWFAHAGHARSADPYFLYSASNIGSVAALIGYPLLFEPSMRLGEQGWAWSGGYLLLVLLIGSCGLLLWKRFVAEPAGVEGEELELSPDISWRRRGMWILLAFAPSSLMLGVTLHISTDVAAVPLLWVVPLALYLLSFVIVFARRPVLRHRWMVVFQVPALALLAATMSWSHNLLWVELLIHLEAFFLTAMVCHGELAARRPAPAHLTEFYLWMSVGGVLGGLFNAVLAPVLFDSVLEYPLILLVATLLRPWRWRRKAGWQLRDAGLDVAVPAALALLMWLSTGLSEGGYAIAMSLAAFGGAMGVAMLFAWWGGPLRFSLGLGVLMIMAPLMLNQVGLGGLGKMDAIYSERSFFGVNRVTTMNVPYRAHLLIHGTTVHGAQRLDADSRKTPLTYYHPDGPLGQLFQAFPFWRFHRVAAVGLGTGAAACYAKPGQNWTFYEIDPVVEKIARDGRYFTFLADCKPDAQIVIGDARLSLQAAADESFDLLILDAFSSDAIPVHLMTAEAFELYRRKLAPGGVIMIHISNRYLDLEPVLGRITLETGFFGVVQYHEEGTSNATLRYPSIWVAMARRPDDLIELAPDSRWEPLRGANAALWTDDYVNIVGAINSNGEGE
jgi:hypothetical protein